MSCRRRKRRTALQMEEMIISSTAKQEPERETLHKGGKRQRLECESETAIGKQQQGIIDFELCMTQST